MRIVTELASVSDRLLPRRLPLVAISARVVLQRGDVAEGERIAERWIRHKSVDVRVFLAERLAVPDAWVQTGVVAGPPRWTVELWHQPREAGVDGWATRSAEILRRGAVFFPTREAAVRQAQHEAELLGVPYREVR